MLVNPLKADVAACERYLVEPLCGWTKPHEHTFRCWDADYMALLLDCWRKHDEMEQLQESVTALRHRLAQYDTGTTGVSANSVPVEQVIGADGRIYWRQPQEPSSWKGPRPQQVIYDEAADWHGYTENAAFEVKGADGKTYWQTSDGSRWSTKQAAADHMNLLHAFKRR